jgi:hypothetical protein
MQLVAWISIVLGLACFLWIIVDEARHPQAMGVMNVVWPVTALYWSVLALWAYLRLGRANTHGGTMNDGGSSSKSAPSVAQIAVGTSHCGAGCMLADMVCDFAIPATGVMLLGSMLWTEYILDFAAAWTLGIAFQYFALKPMSDKTSGQVIWAAIKADTLSILAFQIGMYAWMALVYFKLYPAPHLTPFQPVYWLMMQIGMIFGYATAFPMNAWLIRAGLKEAM